MTQQALFLLFIQSKSIADVIAEKLIETQKISD